MSPTPIKERVSALFDGEVSDFESRRLFDEVLSNDQYKDRWVKYQVIRDSLDTGLTDRAEADFSKQVMLSIADSAKTEALTSNEWAAKPKSYSKMISGVAIATFVVAVSLMAVRLSDVGPSQQQIVTVDPTTNIIKSDSTVASGNEIVNLPILPVDELRQVSTPAPAVVHGASNVEPLAKPVQD